MPQEMTRALRRHHVARLQRNRRFNHGMDLMATTRQRQRALATPALCSCAMCGNPRKFFKERTIQERRALQFDAEQNNFTLIDLQVLHYALSGIYY